MKKLFWFDWVGSFLLLAYAIGLFFDLGISLAALGLTVCILWWRTYFVEAK